MTISLACKSLIEKSLPILILLGNIFVPCLKYHKLGVIKNKTK